MLLLCVLVLKRLPQLFVTAGSPSGGWKGAVPCCANEGMNAGDQPQDGPTA